MALAQAPCHLEPILMAEGDINQKQVRLVQGEDLLKTEIVAYCLTDLQVRFVVDEGCDTFREKSIIIHDQDSPRQMPS